MNAGEIVGEMIFLDNKEKKRFLRGLLRDAKATKRAYDVRHFFSKNALPISLVGGIATCVGVVALGALTGAANITATSPEWIKGLHAAAGITSIGGITAFLSTITKVQDADERAEFARLASEAAKRDIELIKNMQKTYCSSKE